MSRRPTALLAVAAAAMLTLVVTATPAAAHAELDSSDPANGATLAAPPAAVTLTFGEDILAAGTKLVANGTSGPVALGPTTVSGPRVSATWPPDQPSGTYAVSFRVVSADGHPITGAITFSYGVPASPSGSGKPVTPPNPDASGGTTNVTPSATGSLSASDATGGTTNPTPDSSPAPSTTPASSSSGATTAAWVVGGVVVVVVVVLVGVGIALSRRRS